MYQFRKVGVTLLVILFINKAMAQTWTSSFVKVKKDNSLEYVPDAQGNIIPDFSKVGCYQNSKPLPVLPVVMTISSTGENDQEKIQAAIDELSAKVPDAKGFRGAILLKKGEYKIPGTLKINAAGIVLRGEGNETKLIATGKGKRDMVAVTGKGDVKEMAGTRKKITDKYVPVGAKSMTLSSVEGLQVGDKIIVYRPGTANWIHDLKMDSIPPGTDTKQWQPAEYDLHFERVITRINKNKITIDQPIVMSMEDQYGGGEIYKYNFDGRISQNGIEDILCESEYSGDEDEDHGWVAVFFNRIENSWVKNVTSRYFGYSCVNLGDQSMYVTVTGCSCLAPKSIISGGRRYSFNNDGQCNLFMHCFASEGRHDYVTGARVRGPNVFYDCKAEKEHADIGSHHRWAMGTLYDNIVTDGEINIQDRGNWGTGHGWSGVNQILWNCVTGKSVVQNPWVTGKNYAIGVQGTKYNGRLSGRPDGVWEGNNKPGLQPSSLYMAQLKERISRSDRNGAAAAANH